MCGLDTLELEVDKSLVISGDGRDVLLCSDLLSPSLLEHRFCFRLLADETDSEEIE